MFLETGYRGFIDEAKQYAALNCANLGMGTKTVWHGIPDARVEELKFSGGVLNQTRSMNLMMKTMTVMELPPL